MDKIPDNNRIVYLDALRIIACFFVIVNHTVMDIFQSSTPSVTWFLALAWFFLCKSAVPLFLMISGVVLLEKTNINLGKNMRRAGRMVIVLLATTFIYRFALDSTTLPLSVSGFIHYFTGLVEARPNHLWYLYMYIGVICMVPILAKINNDEKITKYAVLIAILPAGTLPILEHYGFVILPHLLMPVLPVYSALLLLGSWMHKRGIPRVTGLLACLFLLIGLQLLMTYEAWKTNPESYLFLDNRGRLFTMILVAACIFLMIKRLFVNVNPTGKFARIVSQLGQYTFSAYLFHVWVYKVLWPVIYVPLSHVIYRLPAMIVFELVVLVFALALGALLKQIPGVKRFI